MSTDTNRQPKPTCPHCGYALPTDDMLDHIASDDDLFALAPDEGTVTVTCPSCSKSYAVQGGYTPHYTSAISEDDL